MSERAAPWWHGEVWAAEERRLRAILAAHPDIGEARLRAGMFDRDDDERHGATSSHYAVSADGVAIIAVHGLLIPRDEFLAMWVGGTTYARIEAALAAASADVRVRSILLDVDSPGGYVTGVEDAAAAVLRARDRKPVHAYVAGLCCSAAYWLASSADRIEAAPSALIGCLGVVQTWIDPSRMLDEAGIDVIEFVSSQTPRKRPDPKEDDGRTQIQRQVDDLADVFLRAVADGRGVSLDTVLADFGQGDSYVAARALAAGMIDEVRARPEVGARRTTPSVHTGPARAAADNHDSPASAGMEDAMSTGLAPDASAEARVKAAEAERDTLRAEVEAKGREVDDLRAQLQAAEQKAAAAADGLKAANAIAADLKGRVEAIERERYEARRDDVIEATVARGAIEAPQRADWVARYDRMAAAGMEGDARALLEGLPSGKAVPQGVAGRAGKPADLEEPAAVDSPGALAAHIKAKAREWGCSYEAAHERVEREEPHMFDSAYGSRSGARRGAR